MKTGDKAIGVRFRQSRESIGISQKQLAKELNSCQSTISSIENGYILPGLPLLHYLYFCYQLDINWLLTGQGQMFLPPGKNILTQGIPEDDPRYESYKELSFYMQIPLIRQAMFGKMEELKVLYEGIKDYLLGD